MSEPDPINCDVINFVERRQACELAEAEAAARLSIIERYGFIRDEHVLTNYERFVLCQRWDDYAAATERMNPAQTENQERIAGKFSLTLIKS